VEMWSAYQYLFALCGLGLLLGTVLAGARRRWAVLVVLVLALGSEHARRLDALSDERRPWNPQSHVSRFYVDRAVGRTVSYLAQLKALHPALPHRSTLFFNRVPAYIAWQFGDGPLIRWAYADSTLRSYFFSDFTRERARRGPVYVFSLQEPELVETTGDPLVFRDLGVSMVLAENAAGARDAFAFQLERRPGDRVARAGSSWVALAAGDTSGAWRGFRRLGWTPDRGPAARLDVVRSLAADGRAAAAESLAGLEVARHALDPEAHRARADLVARLRPGDGDWIMERFATRVLAPGDPGAWRAWAWTQWQWGHYAKADASLRRYFALAGPAGAGDREARELQGELGRVLPGGDLAQRALRER